MPWWAWLLVAIAVTSLFVAWLVRRKRRELLDPALYATRSSARFDQLLRIHGRIYDILSAGRFSVLNATQLAGDLFNLTSITSMQRVERLPDPAFEGHRRNYAALMDVYRRMMEDFRDTGGEDWGILLLERNEILDQFYAQQAHDFSTLKAMQERLGQPVPYDMIPGVFVWPGYKSAREREQVS